MDKYYHLKKSNFMFLLTVCGPPPVLSGISYTELVRQDPNYYYLGDLLQASCDVFGEELVDGHTGLLECLATGMWTPKLPVCRSLYY